MESGLILNILFRQRELRDKVEKHKKLQPNLQEFHPLCRLLPSMQGKTEINMVQRWIAIQSSIDQSFLFGWNKIHRYDILELKR
jgi:hypothetical protein